MSVLWRFKAGHVHSGFGLMEEYSWSPGECLTGLFIQGWLIHACCKLHITLHVPSCHLSPLSQQEVPTPLHAKYRQRQQGARMHCITQQDSAPASPLKAMGTVYQAILKVMGNCFLSCPDIWVRKPDWLHLPYPGDLTLTPHLALEISSFFPLCSKVPG